MSIEDDATTDLEMSSDDAENVVGGAQKKGAKKASHKAAGHSLPPIIVHTATNPVEDSGDDGMDHGES